MKYTIKYDLYSVIDYSIDRICKMLKDNNILLIDHKQLQNEDSSTSIGILEAVRYMLTIHGATKLKNMYDENKQEFRNILRKYFVVNYKRISSETEHFENMDENAQAIEFKISSIHKRISMRLYGWTKQKIAYSENKFGFSPKDYASMYLVNSDTVKSTFSDYDAIEISLTNIHTLNNRRSIYNVMDILKRAGIEQNRSKAFSIEFDEDNLSMNSQHINLAFALSPVTIAKIIDKDINQNRDKWIKGDVSANSGFTYPTITLFNALNKHGFTCKQTRYILSNINYHGKESYNPLYLAKYVVQWKYKELDNTVQGIATAIEKGKYDTLSPAQHGKTIRQAFQKYVRVGLTHNFILSSDKYEKYLANTNTYPDVAWLFAYYSYINELTYIVADIFANLSIELPRRIYKGETYTHLLEKYR